MASSARPEPMNSSPYHSKVKVSMTLAHQTFVAGKFVSGKMEMECRADKGLGIGIMMVELFATQGPGLPPSNAVQAHPRPGDPPLTQDYHQARRGISTFLFRIPLPSSAPSSISFGGDLARVRYELRATIGVVWKGEKRLVTCTRPIEVVESYEHDFSRQEPEGVVVGEFGKIWVHGKIVGGIIVAGESACVELQVKNHSTKKNSGLTLSLSRTLVLPGVKPAETSPLQISDVLTTIPFRGSDYIIYPGVEGIASLVFDVPKHARGVRGGMLEADESEGRTSQSLFEIRCILGVTINMGIGTKNIQLDIPVLIVHPAALPETLDETHNNPYAVPPIVPSPYLQSPYPHRAQPISPPLPVAYVDPVQHQVWLPLPQIHTPQPHQYFSPPIESVEPQYYFPPPPNVYIPSHLSPRPTSAGPGERDQHSYAGLGLVPEPVQHTQHLPPGPEPEEGKGERAARVTRHLRLSSRHRSVSPRSHRFPLPMPPVTQYPIAQPPTQAHIRNLPPAPVPVPPVLASENGLNGVVHSPRPFLSPKQSFHNSLPKSERVEQLERMAEEVERTTLNLSEDLPKVVENTSLPTECSGPDLPRVADGAAVPQIPVQSYMNRTLPVPPPPTRKTKDKEAPRPRVDTYFDIAPIPAISPTFTLPTVLAPSTVELEDGPPPKTPLAAVTPVKVPPLPQSGYAQLRGESGLDALEKRLLAEVGTRKVDATNERRPVWNILGVQPIKIPSREAQQDLEPLNDSAISSLTLAGGREEDERAGLSVSLGLHEGDGSLEVDGGHDSDEKTHRAGRSSVSGASRRNSKEGLREGERKKKKKREKDGEVHGSKTKRKAAASKGRVAAWLGEIDPEAPPMEELALPHSSDAPMKLPPFPKHGERSSAGSERPPPPVAHEDASASGKLPKPDIEEVTAFPNPRSSGFVPIGTFKHSKSPRQFKALERDATVIQEARLVTDLWSLESPAPLFEASIEPSPAGKNKDQPTRVSKNIISPARVSQSIRTGCKVSPPSISNAFDVLAASHHTSAAPMSSTKAPPSNNQISVKHEPPKIIDHPQPQPLLRAVCQPDPEVKYDVRSARGGRGGRVTAITSIWASQAASSDPKSKASPLIPSSPVKPVRTFIAEPKARDPPKAIAVPAVSDATKPASRAPVKSLLTASAPPHAHILENHEPKRADLMGRRPRPMVKSSSVPAVISSSHATPVLSSTASLARPSPEKARLPPVRVPPAVSEGRSDLMGRMTTQGAAKVPTPETKPEAARGDMAFGQARLRDLIKKYQGQAT
ncbi:hypothetical protein H0H81_004389 [Sphagnurus paluster]|uniref:Arrestin-like N-terminal domain-containing protein n=1 Tax=Sphagnurus paluster TaxID=117069 RepID=A0A9P7GL24_9AGAR|nr:hypothetical protein H0H81_004389 [Sphagnurus paluster]